MTADKFIQSFGTHKTGDKGFCKLASMSTNHAMCDFGFWFEIIRNNGNVLVLSIQYTSYSKKQFRKTLLLNGLSQVMIFVDDIRQKAQDELCKYMLRPSFKRNSAQTKPDTLKMGLYYNAVHSKTK